MITLPFFIYPVISSFYTIFALLLWFDGDVTNFISKALRSPKWLKRNEYEEYLTTEDLTASYPEFLYAKYPSFFTKLISCPICLTFWITLFHSILIFKLNFILFLPICYVSTLFIYLYIRKLL